MTVLTESFNNSAPELQPVDANAVVGVPCRAPGKQYCTAGAGHTANRVMTWGLALVLASTVTIWVSI